MKVVITGLSVEVDEKQFSFDTKKELMAFLQGVYLSEGAKTVTFKPMDVYNPYIERGSREIKPAPFMQGAAKEVPAVYVEELKEKLKEAGEKVAAANEIKRRYTGRKVFGPLEHVLFIGHVLKTRKQVLTPQEIAADVFNIFGVDYHKKSISAHIRTAMNHCPAIKKKDYGLYFYDTAAETKKTLEQLSLKI